MTKQQKKILQYLNEAHGSEQALARQLQAQIAMTPKGRYRNGLETHLDQTRRPPKRLEDRLREAGATTTRYRRDWAPSGPFSGRPWR